MLQRHSFSVDKVGFDLCSGVCVVTGSRERSNIQAILHSRRVDDFAALVVCTDLSSRRGARNERRWRPTDRNGVKNTDRRSWHL